MFPSLLSGQPRHFVRLLPAAALVCLLGCVPKSPKQVVLTADELLNQAQSAGLTLENPFALNDEIRAEVDKDVGRRGTAFERVQRITRFMHDRGYLNFKYDADTTLTACQAFESRRGNCLAYTNLFVGIARYLKVPVYFVYVSDVGGYFEKDGLFFVSSHMAIGFDMGEVGAGPGMYKAVVDLSGQISATPSLYRFEAIDDASAVAYFYNNVAVEHMLKGDTAYAERLLRFLLEEKPRMKEIYNNLSVVQLRKGEAREALKTLRQAMEMYPSYPPFYTNAVQAANAVGNHALAERLEEEGRRVASRNPSFLFNQGLDRYDKKDYEGAADYFKRALKYMPNSPFLYAYLAKACLSGGKVKEGLDAFATSQEIYPNNPSLEKLRKQFPELAQVPRPQTP